MEGGKISRRISRCVRWTKEKYLMKLVEAPGGKLSYGISRGVKWTMAKHLMELVKMPGKVSHGISHGAGKQNISSD